MSGTVEAGSVGEPVALRCGREIFYWFGEA
jgi:hypothetical protein